MKKKFLFLAFFFLLLFCVIVFFMPLKRMAILYFYGEERLEKQLVDSPDNPVINSRLGREKYKNKKFSKAKAFFTKAAKNFDEKDKKLKALAYANAGNSNVRVAEILIDKKTKKKEAKIKAIEVLNEAISDYQRSLDICPLDEKVLTNKEIAENLLKSLQQDPGNNQNKNDGQEDKQPNDDNDSNKDHQKKGSGDQSSNNHQGKTGDDNSASENKNDVNKDSTKDSDDQSCSNNSLGGTSSDSEKQGHTKEDDQRESKTSTENKKEKAVARSEENKQTPENKNNTKSGKNEQNMRESSKKDDKEGGAEAASENAEGQDSAKDLQSFGSNIEGVATEDLELEEDAEKEQEEKETQKMILRVAQQNMDAELKKVEDREIVLRKQQMMGSTTKGAYSNQKGW